MKKGFTLMELLAVIVIVAVISTITFPMVTSYINDTKEKLYEAQIKDIELAAEKWALEYNELLDKYHINDTVITVHALKAYDVLKKDEILDPKTKEEMKGYVLIKYDNDKKAYTYKYYPDYLDEVAKPEIASEQSTSYVIYAYNILNREDPSQEAIKIITTHSNTPFYLDILKNNTLHVIGETVDGLYETENEYIFKGSTVNNYVKFESNIWRILSINKKDYTMKLMSVNVNVSNVWSEAASPKTTDFKNSTFQTGETTLPKVIDTWHNGVVPQIGTSINVLRSNLIVTEINSKEGMVSLYDYVAASLSNNCDNNFLSEECKNQNYIATMYDNKSVWTMNHNGDQIWYINAGNLSLADSTSGPYYYSKVIKLPINIYATNIDLATGSDTQFAYEIK